MSDHFKTLQTYLPWIQSPLIVNGPMGGYAGSKLAIEVTRAGGNGQIGSVNDAGLLETQLSEVQNNFANDPNFKHADTLPIGVGFLCFIGNLEALLPVVKKYKPAVLWMFAAHSIDDYTTWTKEFRSVSPASKIWIQTGSVSSALKIASAVEPDTLIIQGADAGGHGYEKGCGIMTLLPETIDSLASNGFGHIPVLASGGIIDGRGVAAALTLGACGVVMGTRFLSATETVMHPRYREKILKTKEGGESTIRAKLFDELKGPNVWPVEYDGRGLVSASYRDHANGVSIERIRESHSDAVKEEHKGFGEGEEERAVVWAGSGVGLVRKEQPAREIVAEVRDGAKRVLSMAVAKI